MVRNSVAFLTLGSGMDKKPNPGSGMHIPDHFSESLEKILEFFDADTDPGSVIFLTLGPGWKNSDPGSGINIPDPQQWLGISWC
jgi:hypothetical protein